MKQARCTYCGEIIDVLEYENACVCKKCNETISVKNALDFIGIPDEVALEIKDLRKNMLDAYYTNKKYDLYAREIKDIIPNDFVSGYLFAKSKQNNKYFLNKFFQDANKEYLTSREANFVVLDIINNLELYEPANIVDFIKKIASTPVELMSWIDELDSRIEEIKNEKNIKKRVNVIYDNSDVAEFKKLKEALLISEYGVSSSNYLATIVITSKNCMNEEFKSKLKSIDEAIEFKLDDFTHDVYMNQYLGIDDYVLVKDNLMDSFVELIDILNRITKEEPESLKDIKESLKEENLKYFAKLEEKRLKEEQALKELELKKKKEEEERERLELQKKLEASQKAAKIKDEEERLDRMEQFIFESYYNPNAIKQTEENNKEEVYKQIKRVTQLIEMGEIYMAIDLAYDLLEEYPKDYRVYFLIARLESNNFKDINNQTHIKYIEQALSLANSDEKEEMLKEYIPYSTQREKASALNELGSCLNERIKDVQASIKYYNEGIRCYKAKDIKNAMDNWKKSSELNNSESCYCLAYQYISGKNVEKNITNAMILLLKAAKNNHEKSIQMLADIYERGLFEFERDPEAACYYYGLCIDKNNHELMTTIKALAEQYLQEGLTKPASKAIALRYYEMLADNGDIDGMLKAANLHAYGLGQIYDRSKTVYYFKKAASLHSEQGMARYAEIVKKGLYETKKDPNKYVELIKELADTYRNNLDYQKAYIELYEFGLYGVPKSDKIVVKLYEDLARIIPDEIYYKLKLAEIYEKGLYNVAIDYKRAINLYNEVALKNPNCEEAQLKLADVYEKGLYGVKKDLSKVGKIYGMLANKYPKNVMYLNKLADLFMMSSGKNAFEVGMKYYKKSYDLGSFDAGIKLALGYYNGDFNNQFKDYKKVLECAEGLLKYDRDELTMEEENLYFKLYLTVIKIYANGGYNVNKNEEKARELLKDYNEKAKNKVKYKELVE